MERPESGNFAVVEGFVDEAYLLMFFASVFERMLNCQDAEFINQESLPFA